MAAQAAKLGGRLSADSKMLVRDGLEEQKAKCRWKPRAPQLCQQESCRKGSKNGSEGGQLQAARCCTPSDGFPLTPGGVPLGRGRKPGPDGEPPLLQQPASQPLGTERCPRGSLVAPWVERMVRGGDCVFTPLALWATGTRR